MIDARTTVGPVELGVADLVRARAFYTNAIGLAPLEDEGAAVTLGIGDRTLVRLVELPGARPAPHATGLFHLALLVPDRPSLARWLAHAAREQVPLQGMSDHVVSEAAYLADPDGHGIEICCDRPRATWEGRVMRMTTLPLDVADLLAELGDPATEPFDGLPQGTMMGHVHLQVRDVAEAIAFYRDVVGLELMATYGAQAAFLAAGGYHHRIGVNTWRSRGASRPPPDAAALRHATIAVPDAAELLALRGRLEAAGFPTEAQREDEVFVRDPSGITLRLTAA
ncbi:MAG: VOC family protein [Actinobacteria bacterium]|nr:VOC family protein [Actinomycetota bacterium]